MTNAERQAKWRERRAAEVTELARLKAAGLVSIAKLRKKLQPLLNDLMAEGKKNMATMSPGTVLHRTVLIQRVLDEFEGRPVVETAAQKRARGVK